MPYRRKLYRLAQTWRPCPACRKSITLGDDCIVVGSKIVHPHCEEAA